MEKLFRIKKYREDNTYRALQDKRRKLETAEQVVVHATNALTDYRKGRIAQEEAMFTDVSKQPVGLRDLNHFTTKTMQLRETELVIKQKLEDANKECTIAVEVEAAAKKRYVEALKARYKIESLNQKLMDEHRKTLERVAERELEDVPMRVNAVMQ